MQSPAYQFAVPKSSGCVCVSGLRDNMDLLLGVKHHFHRHGCQNLGFHRVVRPDDRHPVCRVGRNRKNWLSEYHGHRLSMVSMEFSL